MKKKPAKRPVFQAALDEERLARLQAVAKHKGVSKTGQVRMWIDAAYARLPETAK